MHNQTAQMHIEVFLAFDHNHFSGMRAKGRLHSSLGSLLKMRVNTCYFLSMSLVFMMFKNGNYPNS